MPRAVLGGDFFDAVTTPEGTVRAVIGDVCGHGPSEAAVGVALRIAWRTMTLAGGAAPDVVASVDAMLRVERIDNVYATLCDISISPDFEWLEIRRHGHPPPLLRTDDRWQWLVSGRPSPPLGLWDHEPASVERCALPDQWSLLLVTDGIYDGRGATGRLGMDGLLAVLDDLSASGRRGRALLQAARRPGRGRNGGQPRRRRRAPAVAPPTLNTSRPSLHRRVRQAFVVAVVVAVAAAALGALAFRDLLDSRSRLVDRVDRATVAAERLLGALVDQETAVRDFVLTGDPTLPRRLHDRARRAGRAVGRVAAAGRRDRWRGRRARRRRTRRRTRGAPTSPTRSSPAWPPG